MEALIKKRIEEASIDYTMRTKPMCIAGDAFADMARELNKNPTFIAGANYALQNQWISVEDALPTLDEKYDFSERYIVRTQNNEIKVMRIFRNIAWCDIFDGRAFIPFEKKIVTHWMEIQSLEGGEK